MIARVRFSRTWTTAYVHGRTLRRGSGMVDANFYGVETAKEFWISGPKRDQTDGRYSNARPEVDHDAHDAYEASRAVQHFPAASMANALLRS